MAEIQTKHDAPQVGVGGQKEGVKRIVVLDALPISIVLFVATRGGKRHATQHNIARQIAVYNVLCLRLWVAHSKYDLLRQYADVVGLEFDKPIVEF